MLVADLVGEAATAESIARHDIADFLAAVDVAVAAAETLPHRRKYLLLSHKLIRRLLELHLEWVEEVERELGPKTKRRPRKGR